MNKNFLFVITILLTLAFTFTSCNQAATNSNTTASNNNPAAATPTVAATKAPAATTKPTEGAAAKPAENAADGEFDGEPKFEEEKVKFAVGASDAIIEQTLEPGVNKTFLLNAKKGQTMWFKVTESTGKIGVDFNKNPVKVGQEVRQVLNASGEWAIYLDNPTKKPLKFSLLVGIE